MVGTGNSLQILLLASALILSALILLPAFVAYAEHIFEDNETLAQHLDILQISTEKFVMLVDDDSYNMYYEYHGSLDSTASKKSEPTLSSISINQERKSLEITFSEISGNSIFWVRIPMM